MADNNELEMCKCGMAAKAQTEKIEQESFAMEMLRESAKNAKRWFMAFIVILVCWLATIGSFVWFLNQYNFESYEVSTDGGGNAYYQNEVTGDIYNGKGESK